ncbi:MAG: hypothetical protein R6V07_13870 [Armatimonadota bacterium]
MGRERAAPGQWVRRVGIRERVPRVRAAEVSVRQSRQRRREEGAPTAICKAERLARRSGGAAGEWTRRAAMREAAEVERAARARVAHAAANEETEPTTGATAGDRQVASAPVKREAERLAVSAKPVRANAVGGQRAHGRSMVRFGDPREEQRARVEAAR